MKLFQVVLSGKNDSNKIESLTAGELGQIIIDMKKDESIILKRIA
jgi:hypothetical protein